jgi:hypothetical protein
MFVFAFQKTLNLFYFILNSNYYFLMFFLLTARPRDIRFGSAAESKDIGSGSAATPKTLKIMFYIFVLHLK